MTTATERQPRARFDARVAAIAAAAHDSGGDAVAAVAAHYGASRAQAQLAINRARKAGHEIPDLRRAVLVGIDGFDQREPCGEWVLQAACAGIDPDLMFPGRGEDVRPAKRICNGDEKAGIEPCPVKAECLEHALANREVHGVWGGLSERERRRLRRTLRLAVAS